MNSKFKKASYSQGNGNCVEVAFTPDNNILVRDSKDKDLGPTLLFTSKEWDAFINGVKSGEFDL